MKLDRFFYIPAAAVKEEVEAVEQKAKDYREKRNAFLNEMGTHYYALNYDQDRIVQIGYEYGVKMPDGLRFVRETTVDEKSVRMVVPDMRTKAGKIINKKIKSIERKRYRAVRCNYSRRFSVWV